jgi:enoyl-[acyl-carrier-protein] reductase (NADH)
VTGEIVHVDGGVHAVGAGLPAGAAPAGGEGR